MKSWGPWKAWWLDVLKFVVTFAFGAVLTIAILNDLEDERAIRSFQWTKAWERDLDVLEEFRKASLLYVQAAEGALADVSRGKDPHDIASVREWRGPANDRFLLSLEAIEIRFVAKEESVAPLLAKMKNLQEGSVARLLAKIKNLHGRIYGEYLQLKRPDTEKPGFYMWSSAMKEMSELRLQMAMSLEKVIDKAPR